MSKPVRVLVVDDSAFYRKRIRRSLEQSPEIEVVGEAGDGEEASRLNRSLAPDLITMDVVMPVLDGIGAVRRIMCERPVPVVMFSSFTREGARATLDALEAGAVDYVSKEAPADEADVAAARLREKVLALVRPVAAVVPLAADAARRATAPRPSLLAIGASTGGPMAIQEILSNLPADFRLPVLVAVHMPAAFTATYAERLDSLVAPKVREAADGMPLRAGEILIAPGGRQTLVENEGGRLLVRITNQASLYRPCIDITFGSAAAALDAQVLAVILTGMGSDGLEGARKLHAAGAQVWAQDEATSVVYGMPQAVARAGLADRVLPLEAIASAVLEVV